MKEKMNRKLPDWVIGFLAIGCLVASGIHLGIASVEGLSANSIIKAIGYGVVGLVMFIGIYRK